MEQQKRGKGRPCKADYKGIVKELAEKGYGYIRSIPLLIEAGFVDENGNCTISESNFSYTRKKVASSREFKVKVSAEQYTWANEHQDEIVAYIQMRMEQEK